MSQSIQTVLSGVAPFRKVRSKSSVRDTLMRALIPAAEQLEDRTLFTSITFEGTVSNSWDNASNWSPQVIPNSNYEVVINAGKTVDINDNDSADTITAAAGSTVNLISGGSLGVGTATFNGAFNTTANQSGMTLTAINAQNLILNGTTDLVGCTLGQINGVGNISNSGSLTVEDDTSMNGITLTNAAGGYLTIKGGANFTNTSVINQIGGTVTLPDSTGLAGGGSFTNKGLLNVNPGNGNTAGVSGPELIDTGGTINVESGTFAISDSAFFDGASFNTASGAVLALNPISSGNNGDTFYFSGTSSGGGSGSMQFNGGSITVGVFSGSQATSSAIFFPVNFFQVSGGAFVNNPQAGSIQEVTNTGYIDFVGANTHGDLGLINQGTLDVTGTGDIGVSSAGAFTNDAAGVIDFQADASFIDLGGNTAFVNMGTIEKTGGTGLSSIDFDGYEAGTSTRVDAQTGTIDYPSGFAFVGTTFQASAGATISLDSTGDGFGFSGTINGSGAGNLIFTTGTIVPYNQNGPAPSAAFNFSSGFALVTGGSFNLNPQDGTVAEITNNGFLEFAGSAAHPGIGFINNGTIDVTGIGDLQVNTWPFTNDASGIINFEADANVSNPGGNPGGFTNMGLIEKTGGTGTTTIGSGTNNIAFAGNGGTYDVESGTLSIANGGSSFAFTIPANGILAAPGTDFDLGGAGNTDTINLQGSLTVSGGGTVTLSGDYLAGPNSGDGQSTTAPATLNFDINQFTVDGGGFRDNVDLINQGEINFSSGDMGSLLNQGTVTLGSGVIVMSGGFINAADGVLLSGTSDGIFRQGNNGNVQNAGVFVMSPGAGNTFDMTGTEIYNTGTLLFGPGTTKLPWLSNSYDNAPGLFPTASSIPADSTFQLDSGATVDVDTSPSLAEIDGTVIMNAGSSFPALDSVTTITGSWSVLSGDTVSLTGGLTNNGKLSIGGSFTVNGTYTQAVEQYVTSPPTPTLDFEVAAAAGSANAPLLNVTGAAALAGNLTADYVDGYNGSAGAYTVATFTGGATGSFASTSGTAPFFTPSISSSQIVLNGTAFTGSGGSNPGGIAVPTGGTGGGGGGGGGGTTTGNDDLAISGVTAPSSFTAGSSQTITWAVTNSGAGATGGSWQDSVFLSTTTSLSSDAVLLGRVTQSTAVAAGGTYTGTLTTDMPAVAPGPYYVIVVVDSRQTLGETSYSNNTAVSAATTETVPSLTLGNTSSGTISASQQQLFTLSLTSGEAVKLAATFATTLEAELYVGTNTVPTPENYTVAATDPNQTAPTLLIDAPVAATYYVLLDGRPDVSGSQAFSLTPTVLPYGPASVTPTAAAAIYQTTLTIQGNGFTPSTAVTLVDGSTTLKPADLTFVNAQTLYATFGLYNQSAGTYSIVTTQPDGTTASLPSTFTVNAFNPNAAPASSLGHLVFQFNAPAYLRAGGTAVATITYQNVGGTEVLAPLFEVTGTNAEFQLQGMSTFDNGSIDIIGTPSSGPAGVIQPGQSRSVQITYEQGTDAAHTVSNLNAFLLDPTNAIDWDAAKKPLKPVDQSQQAWDTTWANFESLVGTTVGSYQQELSYVATELGSQGYRTTDVARYLSQIEQIAGDFGTINYRDTLTSFGYGQSDPYDISLAIDSDGNAAVGANNAYRYFLVQPNGSFVNEDAPADSSTLVKNSDGTYTLTEADGSRTIFNSSGTLTSFYDANGNQTTVVVTNGFVTQLTNAFGAVTTINRSSTGMVSSITDPVGRTENFSYDSQDNLTSISGPSGTITYIYADPTTHDVTEVINPDGTEQFYSYDSFDRVNGETQAGGADPLTMTYNALGTETVTDALGRSYTIALSADGGVESVQDPTGDVISQTEGSSSTPGLLSGPDGESTLTNYNSAGDVSSVETATGATITMAYNSNNQLSAITDPDNNTTKFTYDANGNLLTSTDPANATTTYTYTSQGLIASATSAAGRAINNTYNGNGQLVSQTFSDGSTASYSYDAHGNILTAANSQFGTETFTYTAAGQVSSVDYPNGLSLNYTYNSDGQLTTMTDQTGASETYAYNAQGQIDQVLNAAGQVLASYTYDASGNVDRIDLGNGTYTTIGYDQDGRENSIINYAANGTIQSSFLYSFDGSGLITSMTTLAGTTTYSYDGDDQLVSATLPGGRTLTWTYDAAGNRIQQTDTGSSTTNYTTNNLNQYTAAGSTTYTYDADGNMLTSTTAGVTTTYTYTAGNRLASITNSSGTTTFTYDALGNLVAETVNGVTTDMLVDPTSGEMTGEFGAAGSVIAEYQYGRGLIGESLGSSTAATDYYQFDSAGNVAALTSSGGAVLNSYTYLPFGQSLASTGSTANLFTFDGLNGVQTLANGNYLTKTRLYSSTLGRFTQRDPLGFDGGTTNLYQYAGNDAVNQEDPSGEITPAAAAFLADYGFLPLTALQNQQALGSLEFATGSGAAAAQTMAGSSAALSIIDGAATNAAVTATGEIGGSALATGVTGSALETAIVSPGVPGLVAFGTGTSEIAVSQGVLVPIAGVLTPVSQATAAVIAAAPAIAGTVVIGTGYVFTHQDQAQRVFDRTLNRIQNINTYSTGDTGISKQKLVAALMRTKLGALLSSSGVDLTVLSTDTLAEYLMQANQDQNQTTQSRSSDDPNDISGPAGYGTAGFIPAAGALPYQITFENAATASAPAAVVTVTQTLSSNLDWSTFQLGAIGYGSTTIAVPAGLQTYTTAIALSSTLTLDIAANFDAATGVITWTFTTTDNATGDVPSDPSLGFLPPDVTPPQGEGFVDYTVSPLATLSTGATISAQASIVFDNNAAIATPLITNTIDAVAPASTVATLAATQGSTYFNVSWSGSDDAGGSGIVSYTIFVSEDGAVYTPWLANTTATSATYLGSPGHTYSFFSQAIDGAGNLQTSGYETAQATTMVPAIVRTLTFSKGKPVSFIDAAGVRVVISLSGTGTGTLSFISTGNADPVSLVLTGTTARSSVSVHAARGTLTLGSVAVNGSLASFNAPQCSFVGTFTITGTLANLVLGNETIVESTLTISGSGVPTSIRMGTVQDLALTDAAAIKSLTVTSWTDGPLGADAISAPSIGVITAAGNFDPSLTLTGAALDLRSISVRGTLSGTWTITGSVAQITAGATASTWAPTITGNVTGLTVRATMSGSLAAASLQNIHVGGNLLAATITLSATPAQLGKSAAINSITIGGSVVNSDIITQGSIRSVIAAGFSDSELFAGVVAGTSTLPTATTDFAGNATIGAVRSRGKTPFANTLIAAAAIGSVDLVDATTGNGGTPFGVAAESLKTFTLSEPKQKTFNWNSKKAVSLLSSLPGDLRVSIV